MSEGVKHDTGKAPMSLLSTTALRQVAEVLAFGAKKYAADNWRGGMAWRRLIDAAMRHLTAFSDGEDLDPESGLPHLAHAACCLQFLQEYQAKGMGTDDRFKPAVTEPLTLGEQMAEAQEAKKTLTRPPDSEFQRVCDLKPGTVFDYWWADGKYPFSVNCKVTKHRSGESYIIYGDGSRGWCTLDDDDRAYVVRTAVAK